MTAERSAEFAPGPVSEWSGRLMSCSLTERAVRERQKTVTRRLGWKFLKPGDRLQLCRKVMGRKPGEPLEKLAWVEVVDVRREPLFVIDDNDVEREGLNADDADFTEVYVDTWFPSSTAWVEWFCEEMGVEPDEEITRIEWRYLDV